MTAGRPTDYKPIFCKKVSQYLKTCVDEDYKLITTDGAQSTSYKHKIRVHLPSLDGFCKFLNVSRNSLYRWREEHKEFRDATEAIIIEQKKRLIERSMSGDYNSTIAKLVLSSNHDMREKTEVEMNVTDISSALDKAKARSKEKNEGNS